MKIGFVCWRPYQLMNTINFIEEFIHNHGYNHSFDQIDLYISDVRKIELKYLENIFFDHIIEFRENSSRNIINKVVKYLFLRSNLQKNILPCSFKIPKYDYLIATGYDNFFVSMCNINRQAKIVILEDGMGTYINDEIQTMKKIPKIKAMKFFNLGALSIRVNRGYSYYPELIQYKTEYRVEKMPIPSKRTIQICQKIFNFSEDDKFKKYKMIYLTFPDSFVTAYGVKEEDFFKKIFGNDNTVLIRLHPKKSKWLLDNQIDEKNEMWELQCNCLMSDNILISVFSTAMITPFLIYGKSCKLVYLYKLLYNEKDSLYVYAEGFLSKIKEIYPNDIYIPETYDEAKDIIKVFNHTLYSKKEK